jgi:hypothetical protein
MKQKTSFYFILYLVAIVSLLDVITERDEAQEEMVGLLLKKISSAPVLSTRDTVVWTAKENGRAAISVAGLSTPLEMANIRYAIASLDPAPPAGLASQPEIDSKGNAVISGKINEKGTYSFQATATVEREIPTDIPDAVREAIHRLSGEKVSLKSEPVNFVLKVEGNNIAHPALTLNIEPPNEDKWILGVPYTKTVYVGGPSPDLVTFTCSDARFKITKEVGRVQLTWAQPMSGITKVTIRANANRDLGALDAAEAKFSIDVGPPRWQPDPRATAYNRVNYRFESTLGGLSATEYTIQVIANKADVKATISPNQFPYELKPDPSWKTLTFRAVGRTNNMLKEIEVPVKDPPPPQIRWQGETHDGNDHVIKFYCEDVDGSDVNVNFNVIQPRGVKAVMSPPLRGKTFTIRIKDVTSFKQSQVELAVVAMGIGGASKTPARMVMVR